MSHLLHTSLFERKKRKNHEIISQYKYKKQHKTQTIAIIVVYLILFDNLCIYTYAEGIKRALIALAVTQRSSEYTCKTTLRVI